MCDYSSHGIRERVHTMRADFQHSATRGLGLQIQLRPQDRRHLCSVGSLCADFDLILGDVVIQAGQKLLREVVTTIDAPVVSDELVACHLLGHLEVRCGSEMTKF